jgi:hypothetical protein
MATAKTNTVNWHDSISSVTKKLPIKAKFIKVLSLKPLHCVIAPTLSSLNGDLPKKGL